MREHVINVERNRLSRRIRLTARVAGCCALFLLAASLAISKNDAGEGVDEKALVYVIPIQKAIEPGLLHMVRRGIEEARRNGADLLILDMDTPGGRVDSAVEIKNLLLDPGLRRDMTTATFINPHAVSAGALLALCTEKIFMTQNGVIGDAAPVTLMPGGGTDAEMPEKVVSYVRNQFISAAEIIGYATDMAAAMVDKRRPFPPYSREGEILMLTSKGASEVGLSLGTLPTLDAAIAAAGFPEYEAVSIIETWSESVARFLTNPVMTGLLMTIGILAIAIEFYTPGIGLPGLVGVICFAILFWGHSVAGLAGYEVLIVLVLGLILLSVELFVTPGFGVMGVSGIMLIFAALVFAIADRWPTHELYDISDLARPMLTVLVSFLLASLGLAVFAVVAPTAGPVRRRLILATDPSQEVTSPGGDAALVGRRGVAQSDLRPSGTAVIGGKRMSVVSEGKYISSGSKIVVIGIEGTRPIVTQASSEESR